MKHTTVQERYDTLDITSKKQVSNIENLTQEVADLQAQLARLKQEAATYEEQLKRECEDARVEAEDLSDLLKTKDRMLEDQNIVISEIKDKNKELTAEIKNLSDSKQKYRDFYEEKL